MSAVLVKTAVYALFRALTMLGAPPAWWGGVLLALGVVTAVGGILFALAQGDLKRLLAYSTIENIGIIFIGLGIGTIGRARGMPGVAALGYAGALLHVVGHSVMKGLLFAGAGAVLTAAHTRSIERLGGLLKAMPATGGAFLVGAAAISGLPGLAGFASEWLVYAALLRGGLELGGAAGAASLAAVPALAVAGGLAAAALAKAFGLVFLGAPRSDEAAHAREVPHSMRFAMVALAALAAAIGLFAADFAAVAIRVAQTLVAPAPAAPGEPGIGALRALEMVSWSASLVVVIALALVAVRHALLAARPVTSGPTWGCGYSFPTARMQYTGASFARPIVEVARFAVRPRLASRPPAGPFPGLAARQTRVEDPAEERLFRAGVRRLEARLLSLRWLQAGRLQQYILYIFATVLALLVWQLLASGGKP
jgi:formate hydrogenlyase subunit 3/multisubunit Na+/H+ antiporter MnhD subunit